MPKFNRYTRNDLERTQQEIYAAVYQKVGLLQVTAWKTTEPVTFDHRQSGEELHLAIGDKWGNLFDCAWFHFSGVVPPEAAGQQVVALIDVSGELCVVDQQGIPRRGLTNMSSEYDFSLGKPGKRMAPIFDRAKGGESFEIWADAGANDLFGSLRDNGTLREADIAICFPEVRDLYYDFEVLLDFFKVLPEESPRSRQVLEALQTAAKVLAQGITPQSATAARRLLRPALQKRGGDPALRISAIGHAHIDLVWLWPARETMRKGARTFATALTNMKQYPDYCFGASQPQLFQWIKDQHPALYAQVKQRVKEGRFEIQGAMWVEADSNLTCGESLVRQILYGKRFFRQEFDIEVKNLWLPDAFGYSAALPQLLKQSGVDYFMTQKISWNQINTFPHQSFHWQGIDGSQVLAHMLPEDTYNSAALPRALNKIEKNYRDAGVSQDCLLLFGIGDGGGGPGEEHLERLARLKNLAGLSPVKQEPAAVFFERWAKDSSSFPTWVGELYLERHQGTLTTEAKNKWYNRRMEQALRELEWTASLALYMCADPYPAQRLEAIWKEMLFYQFHDCLPGSSIKRVYDECLPRYQAMLAEVEGLIGKSQARLAQRLDTSAAIDPVVVFNSLSWPRREWLSIKNRWRQVNVPAMGCQVVDAAAGAELFAGLKASANRLENDLLQVRFNRDGSLASVFDKRSQREVLAEGSPANSLAVYHDPGDAWDFPMDYADQTPRLMQLVSSQARLEGPRAVLEQVYRLGESELRQEIVLTLGSPRLDFISHLHWREAATMLRTSFPLAIHAEEATFEIQFGHVRRTTHRNTTWDLAKDEVPGHKWVDLSQRDYGTALLNDSKYGHKVKDNVIDLNLLRSAPYPRPPLEPDEGIKPGEPRWGYTDQSDHVFNYALYPHSGDFVAGEVIQAAYAFNIPLRQVAVQSHSGPGTALASFFQVDASNVIIETLKKAEDDNDLIIRLYEATGAGVRTYLHVSLPVQSAAEIDLLEENPQPLPVDKGAVALGFRPFEIKTLKLGIQK